MKKEFNIVKMLRKEEKLKKLHDSLQRHSEELETEEKSPENAPGDSVSIFKEDIEKTDEKDFTPFRELKKEKRKSGISVVGDVPWGTHLCQFYKTKEDLLDILVPYFKAGLENNEFCMWVTSEPLSVEEAERELKKIVRDLDDYINKGQLEILDYSEWYTKNGKFDSGRVLEGWVEKEKYALQNGFDGLRLTGNMFWLGKNDWDDFKSYEETVNDVIDKHRMIAICSYSIEKCNASEIIDVVSNHQFAIIRRENKWNIIKSSERKNAEEKLVKNETKYRQLIETLQEGIWALDEDANTTFVNPRMAEMLGYTVEEMQGKHLFLFMDEHGVALAKQKLEQRQQGIKEQHEFEFIKKDGTRIYALLETSPLTDKNGNYDGALAGVLDITERKNAEEMLKQKEEYFRSIIENSSDVVTVLDSNGIVQYQSPNYRSVWGRNPVGEIGKDLYKDVHPDDVSTVSDEFKRLLEKSGSSTHLQVRAQHEDRSWRVLDVEARNLFDHPSVRGIVVNFHDITERKRTEEALRESEEKYRNLIQNSKDSIVIIDLEGNVKFANEASEKMTGYSLSEGVGMNVKKITPLGYWPKSFEALQKAKKGKSIPYFESEIKRKDGEIVQVETGGQPILRDGKVVGVQIITRDITERKKTENELKNNEEKLRKIIDSSPDGIMLTDLQGNIIECNQLALEMYGTSVKKELADKNSFDLIAPEYRERAMENLKKTLKSDIVKNLEYALLKKDGSKYPAELSVSVVNDQNDNPKYFLAIVRDISERKRAEEAFYEYRREIEQQNIQLKKADQLKTDFLNVTSHELRTPMSAIKGYVQIILKQALGQISDEQKKALDVVLRNTDRLDALIQDILDISRLESGTMKFIVEHIEIRKMLDEIVETMQPYANQKEIKINMQLEDNLPELTADKERIKQVIINIVHNAVKFSSTDSIINIRTRKEQDNILFEIQDFGKGIPQDQQEKVFEMFYQVDSGADRKFGGIGLGLAISRGIVVSSGGKIWVESTVGEGSTFKFTLPLAPVKDVESRFKEMDLFGLERKRR